MDEDKLLLEDWKMTKDRIKHFDDVVIRIRLQGIPIATAIFAVGFASFQYTREIRLSIGCSTINAPALIILLGSLYLIPIFALDLFHFRLLLISVEHARTIEQESKFKGRLQITTNLTSPKLTKLHTAVAVLLYLGVIIFGFILAYVMNTMPPL